MITEDGGKEMAKLLKGKFHSTNEQFCTIHDIPIKYTLDAGTYNIDVVSSEEDDVLDTNCDCCPCCETCYVCNESSLYNRIKGWFR